MDYTNGQLFCGSSVCRLSGNSPSLKQKPEGATNDVIYSTTDSDFYSSCGLNFVQLTGYLEGISTSLMSYSDGTVQNLHVINIQYNEFQSLSLPSDGAVVVNVIGTGDIELSNFAISTPIGAWNVIYNVPNGNKITISGFGVPQLCLHDMSTINPLLTLCIDSSMVTCLRLTRTCTSAMATSTATSTSVPSLVLEAGRSISCLVRSRVTDNGQTQRHVFSVTFLHGLHQNNALLASISYL